MTEYFDRYSNYTNTNPIIDLKDLMEVDTTILPLIGYWDIDNRMFEDCFNQCPDKKKQYFNQLLGEIPHKIMRIPSTSGDVHRTWIVDNIEPDKPYKDTVDDYFTCNDPDCEDCPNHHQASKKFIHEVYVAHYPKIDVTLLTLLHRIFYYDTSNPMSMNEDVFDIEVFAKAPPDFKKLLMLYRDEFDLRDERLGC